MKIEDKNEQVSYHPSLDIKDDVLVLGFRIKKDKENDLFIISSGGRLLTTEESSFVKNEQSFSIDKKQRKLSRLSQKWSADSLNNLIETFNDPLKNISDERALYKIINENLKRYVELEQEADYVILTAWIIGTYFFPAFSAYPYINIKAPKGSGKSQSLNFLNQTAFNAVKARASLPALRDTVDALRGTYLMDQADALHRNNMEDLLDILTDSYKRGGGSVRKMVATKGKNWELSEFEAYSPKAFASISQLPEDLRDRCIVIPLIRSSKNYPSINEEDLVWKEIRNALYCFLVKSFQDIAGDYIVKGIEYKQSNDIFGRRLELWLPIETILRAVAVSEDEITTSKNRFLSRYEFASYQTSEIEVAVIETIILLMENKAEMMLRPKEIASGIDLELFEEDDKFHSASSKQRATIVGRAINKFNLASTKLGRDSQGERYLFQKEQLEKIHNGYFKGESPESDTQTYTDEKAEENKDLFGAPSGVA